MAKNITQISISTDTFQVWLDKTNEILDLINTDIVTASAIGDTTVGSATITGDFVANNISAINDIISETVKVDTIRGKTLLSDTIEVASPVLVSNALQNSLIIENAIGPRIRTKTVNSTWDFGVEDANINSKFIITDGVAPLPIFKFETNGTFTANAFVGDGSQITNLSGNNITLTADNIPNLPASKITSGTLSDLRLPTTQVGKTFTSAVILNVQATATTHAVRADRIISTGSWLSGGGDLTANRTLSVVPQTNGWLEDSQGNRRLLLGSDTNPNQFIFRFSNTTGNFIIRDSGDINNPDGVNKFVINKDGEITTGIVPWARLINIPTTLSNTVNLDGNQTINDTKTFTSAVILNVQATATTHAVRADRTILATGSWLSGGGNLTANRTLSVVPTVNNWLEDSQGQQRLFLGANDNVNQFVFRFSNTTGNFSIRNSANTGKFTVNQDGTITTGIVPWARLINIPTTLSNTVNLDGNQTINDTKTFNSPIVGSITGSATTLQTTRTLWGQNFNGSSNVSGNLTSVGNITGTGAITITSGGSDRNVIVNTSGTGSIILDTGTAGGAVQLRGGTRIYKSDNSFYASINVEALTENNKSLTLANGNTTLVGGTMVNTDRIISTGTWLSGGGNLTADRTFSVVPLTNGWLEDSQGNDRLLLGSNTNPNQFIFRFSNTTGNFIIRDSVNANKFIINQDGVITTGSIASADSIPNLPASKITSGTLSDARLPNTQSGKTFTSPVTLPIGGAGPHIKFGSNNTGIYVPIADDRIRFDLGGASVGLVQADDDDASNNITLMTRRKGDARYARYPKLDSENIYAIGSYHMMWRKTSNEEVKPGNTRPGIELWPCGIRTGSSSNNNFAIILEDGTSGNLITATSAVTTSNLTGNWRCMGVCPAGLSGDQQGTVALWVRVS
jgi:hypothetical protein